MEERAMGAQRRAAFDGLSEAPSVAQIQRAHFFEIPIVAATKRVTAAHNRALVAALRAFAQRRRVDDHRALERFLDQHPGSPYAASVLANLGVDCIHTGRYARALAALEAAWETSKRSRSR